MPSPPRRLPALAASALPQTIRGRLPLLLALPTCALVAIATVGTIDESGRYGAAGRTRDRVTLVLGTEELVHQLQRERGMTAGLLGGDREFRGRLVTQRRASDQARTALGRRLADASPGAGAVRVALAQLDGLDGVRGEVNAGSARRADALVFYTRAITALSEAAFGRGTELSDARLSAHLATLRTLGEAVEATALERGTLNGILAAGAFQGRDYQTFATLAGARKDALDEVDRTATSAQGHTLDATLSGPDVAAFTRMEQRVLDSYGARRLPVGAAEWWKSATAVVDGLHKVQIGVADDARGRAEQLRDDALRRLLLEAALALLAIAGAAVLAVAAVRSVLRPLSALTEEAHRLADVTLPRAVARVQQAAASDDSGTSEAGPGGAGSRNGGSRSARSKDARSGDGGPGGADGAAAGDAFTGSALTARGDEIAEVAGALDRVADTALQLAVDQAVLRRNSTESLASLGRRTQDLVSRQIGFLSALERDESDPDTLANLFQLDHLATQMRRNAESLLVLAGERSPRRWSRPVPMGDVLRSALGEVDDYRRVRLHHSDRALLDGGAVTEVSHLLAELLDNALAASPPEAAVEVYARAHGEDYLVAVVDHGPGLAESALATANRRLSGEESFLVGSGRLLGHYVVGRLAAGIGARVWLTPSPLRGVTASVVLPGRLLSGQSQPDPADLAAAR
ncbi:nitrate- and nitrite sensing domain-containing protein [Streptomyces sp. B1866]|uniref:sensor histidine kinase n=1 Tax=Streptomyces sp. B1866 TaxID=3075431 RepID=UPI00288D2424|nr:nitrate- and nitrite sensing domain-containing protein [Streptomyces sp. B1866]MDT3395071.1 nitrate- and nitrite sensing domain-containing protein [Streptomyces sp. B1866]